MLYTQVRSRPSLARLVRSARPVIVCMAIAASGRWALAADKFYDPSLGTLPQSQGWTYNGNTPSPGVDHVSGGVFSYGPTTNDHQFTWSHRPVPFNFTTATWSLAAEIRLTDTTFGITDNYRRGGFVLYLADDLGNWIIADMGSGALGLTNDDFGSSDPWTPIDLSSGFHTVRLDAGPDGARVFVDDVQVLSLALGTGGENGSRAYFGEASSLARSALTEIRSVSLVSTPVCPADYNGDGFVDGIDSDQFNNDFEAGNIAADYNNDGFVDGIDSDQFNNDFESGC